MDHVGADIKAAHLAGELPEWMLVEDRLYIVARRAVVLTPHTAAKLGRQVRRIAELLQFTPA